MIRKYLLLLCLAFSFLVADEGISQAELYRKNSDIQRQLAMENIEGFHFEKNDHVLDVGCGNGITTAFVAESVPEGEIIGIDISEQMIADASQHYRADNLLFMTGDARNLPFTTRFDKLISFNTLHWILDQEQALKSMYNSMKEGGSALLIVPGWFANNSGILAEKIATSEKWAFHFPTFAKKRIYFTADEYKLLLQKTGFQIDTFKVLEGTAEYKNRDALTAWIAPLMNFTSHLPDELRREFVEEMADEMLLIDPIRPDGTIAARYIMFRIIASKQQPSHP